MSASTAFAAFGTKLKAGNGASPEVFTTIAEVVDIEPPAIMQDTVEVTHMESPGRWREHIVTLLKGGDCTWDMNLLPQNATQRSLITDLIAGTKRNMQVVFSDSSSSVLAFSGYFTEYKPGAKRDDKATCSAKLTITGAITPPS